LRSRGEMKQHPPKSDSKAYDNCECDD
jgi:hypothetical protein